MVKEACGRDHKSWKIF